ncbi:MAG: glycosyltransferase [Candidatus Falkowbacteria bacterium]|nr:glycosyltransferase [Candidatus Falkowbacteria bacterium]
MSKILIIVTKGEIGGAQMSVLNLAKKLLSLGQEIIVGLGEGEFLKTELIKANLTHHQFRYLKRTHNPLANLPFIFELKKFIDTQDINVVHFNSSNSLFGALGAKLAHRKIKTIFTLRGLSLLDKNYQTNPVLKFFYFLFFKFFLQFIDVKVFVCRQNLEYAVKINLVKNGEVIYNGLAPDELRFLPRDESRQFLAQTTSIDLSNKTIIGSIGRLAYAKNYEFLIEHFPEVIKARPNAIFIIIGNGEEKNKYQRLITEKKLSDKIFLLAEIKNAYQCINGFDLFVLPSRYEGLSITLIEALSSSTPILASNVGGNAELLANQRELFELNNVTDFINKFMAITNDVKIKEDVVKHNNEQSNQFDINITAKKYLVVYQK